MFELTEADYLPFAEFALRWRFADATYAQVSPDLLARIRPLSSAAAARLADPARARCEEAGAYATTFRSDEPPAAVRATLRSLPLEPRIDVFVSWDADTAVLTDWEVFAAHWDDFCYPASDDVTVWPASGASWTLCYRHYEVFQFSSAPRLHNDRCS